MYSSKKRRGISSILGTVIVLAITLVLGGLLYAYSNGMFSSLTQNANLQIQLSIYVNPNANQAFLQYYISNTGSVEVYLDGIQIINGNTTISVTFKPELLQPGQSVQNISEINGQITAGQYYTVEIIGHLPNGKPYSVVQNVLASVA
ncbi:archaellin/type IV pilin N-terminal domain-containing protein [Sulfolobus tengchongensis]|uniref:Archaellin/type IV pilin N-terminal domain-containing protein n=1 Tax=Sulfolobus tengchongensis TaxID=207809 RepID=A0AAX4KYF3_9CREN